MEQSRPRPRHAALFTNRNKDSGSGGNCRNCPRSRLHFHWIAFRLQSDAHPSRV